MFRSLAAAVSAALLLPTAHASWVLGHRQYGLVADRLDPLVNPGTVATHVHAVVGASGFGPTINYDSLQSSQCTTAAPQADKSSYWAPNLYHRNSNGTFTRIPIAFVNTYYLHRTGPNTPLSSIEPFPKGLRVLAGDPTRSFYNASDPASMAVSYVCLDYTGGSSGDLQQFPTKNCKDGLRTQIHFPSCWDGVNLDSPDHKSHMSYPVGSAEGGDCPKSHPHKLINLFYEFVYSVGQFDFRAGDVNWVFSNGDATGLGMHADFIMGWDTTVLSNAVKQCTDMFFDSGLEGCAPLAASIDRTKSGQCSIGRVVEEEIDGPLNALPGCNPYTGGAAKASSCAGLVVPAIKGGAAASTLAPAPTSSAAASSSAPAASTHAPPASSSSAAVPSASSPAPSSSAAATSAPAGTGPASSAAATSAPASSSAAAPAEPTKSASSSAAPVGTSKPSSSSAAAPVQTSKSAWHLNPSAPAHTLPARPTTTRAAVALPTVSSPPKQCRSEGTPSRARAEAAFEQRRSAFSKHRRNVHRLASAH